MTSFIFLSVLVPGLSLALIGINLLLATHKPYKQKNNPFECGFLSFLGQNRTEFTISFFLFGLLFLIFDLEIVMSYPYVVSGYNNDVLGLIAILLFFIVLAVGFCFELGKKALTINSRQINMVNISRESIAHWFKDVKVILKYSLSLPNPNGFNSGSLK